MPQRVDRLLRSLLGVADVRAVWAEGMLRQVHLLDDGLVPDHQLIRNAISCLRAGFGIRLDTAAVRTYDDGAVWGPLAERLERPDSGDALAAEANSAEDPAVSDPPAVERAAAAPPPAGAPTNGAPRTPPTNGAPVQERSAPAVRESVSRNGSDHVPNRDGLRTRRRATRTAPAATPPAPVDAAKTNGSTPVDDLPLQLERLDMERHGSMLRCRVVLALDGHKYSAIAEVPHGPAAEAELAARVTLDALRAGALTAARLEGIGFTTIGDNTFLVAAIRDPSGTAPRASAAPLIESMARSATEAVLRVVGPITAVHRKTAEQKLGRL